MSDYEVVWRGRDVLTESLERDYAAMPESDGWDVVWRPTSPLTTPWWDYMQFAQPDPNQHVVSSLERRGGPKRKAPRVLKDWSRGHAVTISQQGSHR